MKVSKIIVADDAKPLEFHAAKFEAVWQGVPPDWSGEYQF
jgi:hypothetical protein